MSEGRPESGGTASPSLAARVQAGDRLALARALTLVESLPFEGDDGDRGVSPDLAPLLTGRVRAHVVGVTGAPGAGKSTLVGRLAMHLRERGRRVGVLAVDPSSPFSGGALLGDRVRMAVPAADPGLFVRSVASRGHQGGLALAVFRMVRVMAAAGMEMVLVETVGAGQNDVGVLGVADTVVLVLNPATGDEIQALKAGIVEIGDVMVINKADLPGAEETYRAVTSALAITPSLDPGWRVPVVRVSALQDQGLDTLIEALERHRSHLSSSPAGLRRRRLQAEWELRAALLAAVERRLVAPLMASGRWAELVERLAGGELSADAAAEAVLGSLNP
ncbi:MAG TPA: methylmalonyl Co-A mutase-associated GTPase MeaB [Limnochordales bacterium]